MSDWPRETHGHLLELEVCRGARTTYRCLECGLRVEHPDDDALSVRPCGASAPDPDGVTDP